MRQFFARVVELREEKSVKCDGKFTADSPSREFLEVTIDHPTHRVATIPERRKFPHV